MTSPEDAEMAPAIPIEAEGIERIATSLSEPELTAVAQPESVKEDMEQAPADEAAVQADMKDEPLSRHSLSGEPVAEESQMQMPNALAPSALPQPDPNFPDNFAMTGGMSLDMLAAFAYQDPMNNIGYFPQSTVPGMLAMDAPLDHVPYLGPSPYIPEPEETRISAYAKLVFDDGYFYMNTYSVVLGRDLAAYNAAIREEKRQERLRIERENNPRDPNTPIRIKTEDSRYSKSIVSESGGILRAGDDSDPEDRRRRYERRKARRASRKSKSDGSSSAIPSRRNSEVQSVALKCYEPQPLHKSKVSVPETAGAVPVDPATLRPSPYDCPLVAIHPPASAPISQYKSISREHVKIAFNSKKDTWEAKILGRNGAFIQDAWYHANDVVPLSTNHVLQIGGITVTFVLPNLDTAAVEHHDEYDEEPVLDRYSEGGKEMSLEFTDERREGAFGASSDEDSDDDQSPDAEPNDSDMEDEEEDEGDGEEEEDDDDKTRRRDDSEEEEEEEEEVEEENQVEVPRKELPAAQPKPIPKLILNTTEKKRGPGRPPKNGIMSKREQREAKKAEQARLAELGQKKAKTPKAEKKAEKSVEAKGAEKTLPQPEGPQGTPTKNKVGRPRKHPLPDVPDGPPREKRKYTKRKPKEPKELKEGEEKGEGSGSDAGKVKKEKAPPRAPRSPSPPMRIEDYTELQMAKPQANYVTLIHEALSNAPTQQLGLPDIYRAIYRKYPYFKFKTQTLGWQSSVRHNLSQHHAFRKVEKDGKGWTWGIVDGISIEKEKKKRATPPPQSHSGQMQHQPLYPGYPPPMGYGPPPPGYMMPPNMPNGQHPNYIMPSYNNQHPPPPHMNGQPSQGYYSHLTGPPTSFAPKIPPQLAAPNTPAAYSSPYGPKPAADTETTKPSGQNTTVANPTSVPAPLIPGSGPESSLLPQPTQSSSQSYNQSATTTQAPPPPQSHSHPVPHSLPPNDQSSIPGPIAQAPVQQAPTSQPPPHQPPSHQLHTPQPSFTQAPHTVAPSNVNNQGSPQVQTSAQVQSPHPTALVDTPNIAQTAAPVYNEDFMQAVEKFRVNLTESMKPIKGPSAAATLVNTAIERVLENPNHYSSRGDGSEDLIAHSLRNMLSTVPGSKVDPPPPSSEKPFLSTMERQSLANQKPAMHVNQYPARNGGQDNSTPTMARPTFLQGQNVSRPPMTTPGYVRNNSEGTVNAQSRPSASSASPIPAPNAVHGASAAKAPTENGPIEQIAGRKRSHDDSTDDARDFKKMATSGPPSLKT